MSTTKKIIIAISILIMFYIIGFLNGLSLKDRKYKYANETIKSMEATIADLTQKYNQALEIGNNIDKNTDEALKKTAMLEENERILTKKLQTINSLSKNQSETLREMSVIASDMGQASDDILENIYKVMENNKKIREYVIELDKINTNIQEESNEK